MKANKRLKKKCSPENSKNGTDEACYNISIQRASTSPFYKHPFTPSQKPRLIETRV
jgi:hypothetical protein